MYELILQAVMGAPWAIMPEQLAAIEGALQVRVNGGRVSEADIAAAITRHSPVAGPRAAHESGGFAVAVIPMYGTLHQHAGMLAESSGGTSTEAVAQAVRSALNDPQVGAVVLDVDSPGGSVFGVDELSRLIFGLRGPKPLVAVADSLMASAAYWIGTAADEVFVTPTGMVGGIGVYQAHVDRSRAYEQKGEKVTFVSGGKYKTEGNDTEPLGNEARAAMQKMVDDYYGMFVGAVSRNRGVLASAVRSGFGEGRVLTAKAALAAKMVDRIGTLEDAIRRAGQLVRSPGPARALADADAIRLGLL